MSWCNVHHPGIFKSDEISRDNPVRDSALESHRIFNWGRIGQFRQFDTVDLFDQPVVLISALPEH